MIFNQHVTYCNGNDNGNRNILVPCNNAKVGEGALNGKGVARERGGGARGERDNKQEQETAGRFSVLGGKGWCGGPRSQIPEASLPSAQKIHTQATLPNREQRPAFFWDGQMGG